jgi:cysteine synthase A
MILRNAYDTLGIGIFADIAPLLGAGVHAYLKIEGFNAAGSIKLKPALAMVEALETAGALLPGATLIETSSGNLGIALALIARCKGYGFVCVTDEKMTLHNRALVRAHGGELVVMAHSSLDDRCGHIAARMATDPTLVWTRQFVNPVNPRVHAETTASEILREFPRVDHLFVGVGTGGTLAGCVRAFGERSPATKIVAVDAAGSHHFAPPLRPVSRRIPGIGATRRSPFLDAAAPHDAVIVAERDAVRACAEVHAATGWLVGGSTGSVLAAARAMMLQFRAGGTVVCIAADMGDRYLDTLYDTDWLDATFGAAKRESPEGDPILAGR